MYAAHDNHGFPLLFPRKTSKPPFSMPRLDPINTVGTVTAELKRTGVDNPQAFDCAKTAIRQAALAGLITPDVADDGTLVYVRREHPRPDTRWIAYGPNTDDVRAEAMRLAIEALGPLTRRGIDTIHRYQFDAATVAAAGLTEDRGFILTDHDNANALGQCPDTLIGKAMRRVWNDLLTHGPATGAYLSCPHRGPVSTSEAINALDDAGGVRYHNGFYCPVGADGRPSLYPVVDSVELTARAIFSDRAPGQHPPITVAELADAHDQTTAWAAGAIAFAADRLEPVDDGKPHASYRVR